MLKRNRRSTLYSGMRKPLIPQVQHSLCKPKVMGFFQHKQLNRSRFSRYLFLALGVIAFLFLHFIHPGIALAGPGGKIASTMFRSFWGKILLVVLTIIFLPFIVYESVKEFLAEQHTLKDLERLSNVSDHFDWLTIQDRVTECFHNVHSAWRKEDMKEAAEWMTAWYWQHQQLAYLDQWEKDGLVNHCRVKSITGIRPLFLRYRNKNGRFDDSRLVVSITANMEDYLAERETGKVVEGKKGFTDVETVWTFIFENGKWLVSNIEEGGRSLAYANLVNQVPKILPDIEEGNGIRDQH